MTISQREISYFKRGNVENPRYWARFGGRPDVTNAIVADLGCGHGSLCIDIALAGAQRVIGLDLNARVIEFAKENLQRNYPQLTSSVEFRCQDVRMTPEVNFDYFVSKDTFEHIIEIGQVLIAMKNRLRPNGRIYTGFGPLWNSPFGDHRRTKVYLPWGHLLLTESYLIRHVNRHNRPDRLGKERPTSIYELGLNKLALADYRRIFQDSGMTVVMFRVNNSNRRISKALSLLRRMPHMEEYFSHNIYSILEKTPP